MINHANKWLPQINIQRKIQHNEIRFVTRTNQWRKRKRGSISFWRSSNKNEFGFIIELLIHANTQSNKTWYRFSHTAATPTVRKVLIFLRIHVTVRYATNQSEEQRYVDRVIEAFHSCILFCEQSLFSIEWQLYRLKNWIHHSSKVFRFFENAWKIKSIRMYVISIKIDLHKTIKQSRFWVPSRNKTVGRSRFSVASNRPLINIQFHAIHRTICYSTTSSIKW